jgi:hypothetical protein
MGQFLNRPHSLDLGLHLLPGRRLTAAAVRPAMRSSEVRRVGQLG